MGSKARSCYGHAHGVPGGGWFLSRVFSRRAGFWSTLRGT